MALPGHGFLAIWNDVAPVAEPEWLNWHTVEHIPERVGVTGFLGGRRYVDPALGHHRYFTLTSAKPWPRSAARPMSSG